jgi:histidinol phosphatase-like PHP family hydrolase
MSLTPPLKYDLPQLKLYAILKPVVYDFHTHSSLSDGVLSPLELVSRAVQPPHSYRAIAITDHVGVGYLERVIAEITKDCALAQSSWNITAIPGVELTYVPAASIAEVARQSKELGAKLVIAHGETISEPVEQGTNLAAVKSPHVDLLAHPGLLSLKEAKTAAENGVFLEISARKGHSLCNGHIAKMARLTGAKLLLNSDAHNEHDLLTPSSALTIARGAGLDEPEINQMLEANPRALLQKLCLSLP